MQMNRRAFFPGLAKDPNVGGDKIGFFKNPAGRARQFTQLGGQGLSVVAASKDVDDALLYVKWFAQPEVQQKWTDLGGASASKAVLLSDAYRVSAPYAPSFVESMGTVKDFWAEPLYVPLLLEMQNRVHDYIVANKGTSKQALDSLVKDWIKVFKQESKVPS
jgi:multiple sugar transport system substrate-binding protein